ncbi:MAG: TerB family tellurite resistance protein [Gammaproteobacteria bacterium]|nr:TerB family tellurite resistance protein [Gammaproteobacteria bacterium]MBK8131825.1 TerB family tellurite resistance protein [Gammaproteobacteria bacterium]MBK9427880.1 TerB family tellurite resistance protein [Gammaproteobacteria bacterium]
MIERIREFFGKRIATTTGTGPGDAIRLATAALLVEVMLTDGTMSADEAARIPELLKQRFGLAPREAEELVELARQEVAEATSLYQFTALVNQHFSAEDKYALVGNLWQVAYADGAIDKYEENLIRHVAELIHLPHSRYIHARNQARDTTG